LYLLYWCLDVGWNQEAKRDQRSYPNISESAQMMNLICKVSKLLLAARLKKEAQFVTSLLL
tara:strand:- start:189 stop:371 length:183 start_codon:yes stop_codon:yes gene_type:complete